MTKKENEPQNKVRMNISVSRDVYEWITKTRGNASRIAEQAYLALKKKMEFTYDVDLLMIKLKNNIEFPQNHQNSTEKEWTRRKLNPRPLQCQCGSNNGQNRNQSSNTSYFENSGKTVDVAFSLE